MQSPKSRRSTFFASQITWSLFIWQNPKSVVGKCQTLVFFGSITSDAHFPEDCNNILYPEPFSCTRSSSWQLFVIKMMKSGHEWQASMNLRLNQSIIRRVEKQLGRLSKELDTDIEARLIEQFHRKKKWRKCDRRFYSVLTAKVIGHTINKLISQKLKQSKWLKNSWNFTIHSFEFVVGATRYIL